MGESVRTVLRDRGDTLKPGDVVALNNPFNGGTHLPDVTVITPVFDVDGKTILFFLGSRGHHADIGGITPGSTPPLSRTLEEEGVIINDFLLVDGGTFREDAFRALLAGGKYPARSPDVNVADIKAQVAANEKGVQELKKVVAPVRMEDRQRLYAPCHGQCRGIGPPRDRSDRQRFVRLSYGQRQGADGCDPRRSRDALGVVDFTGTGEQDSGNFNSPPAVTQAAVLYVFRCLVGDDIPLNDGCLKPLKIVIPEGTFLSPSRARPSWRAIPRSRRPPATRSSALWARSPVRRRR